MARSLSNSIIWKRKLSSVAHVSSSCVVVLLPRSSVVLRFVLSGGCRCSSCFFTIMWYQYDNVKLQSCKSVAPVASSPSLRIYTAHQVSTNQPRRCPFNLPLLLPAGHADGSFLLHWCPLEKETMIHCIQWGFKLQSTVAIQGLAWSSLHLDARFFGGTGGVVTLLQTLLLLFHNHLVPA